MVAVCGQSPMSAPTRSCTRLPSPPTADGSCTAGAVWMIYPTSTRCGPTAAAALRWLSPPDGRAHPTGDPGDGVRAPVPLHRTFRIRAGSPGRSRRVTVPGDGHPELSRRPLEQPLMVSSDPDPVGPVVRFDLRLGPARQIASGGSGDRRQRTDGSGIGIHLRPELRRIGEEVD